MPYMHELMDAFNKIRVEFEEHPPEAILICSPHYQGSVFEVGRAKQYQGSFANFQRPDLIDVRSGAVELSDSLQKLGEEIGFLAPQTMSKTSNIDYGSIVPLRFIDPDCKIPILPISVSMGTQKEHFSWGERLYEYARDFNDNIAFIASTELTQDFQNDPRAYPKNSSQDVEYLQRIVEGNIEAIESFPRSYFENVENSLLPTCILSGFGAKMIGEIVLYSSLVGCGCGFLKFHEL